MRFSPKLVAWREWTGLAAGLLALASMFLPWTTLSASQPEVAEALRSLPPDDVARDAFASGLLAWFGPILLLIAGIGVAVFGQNRTARVSGLAQLWLIAVVVAALLMVFGWIGIDYQFDEDTRALLRDGGIEIHGGVGRYLGMAALVISFGAALLDVTAIRRRRLPRKPPKTRTA